MTEDEFKHRVVQALGPHSESLVTVLRRLIKHTYPDEVVSLHFEVFPDGFTSGFPVRAFFMDKEDSEFFVYKEGEVLYPSPVDPELLEIHEVYREELEEEFQSQNEEADVYTLAGQALIPWFSRCWVEAGGLEFGRHAEINLHDDFSVYNLVKQEWQV